MAADPEPNERGMPSSPLEIVPITIEGRHVRLVPLSAAHHDGLVAAARDGELWRLWYTSVPEPHDMAAEIERRLGLQSNGAMLPFTVLDRPAGRVVGMTTYMNIDAANRRVEIGSTWYASRVQRTALNTEAKLLLLEHAFDTLDCIAVEFRTHFLNQQSRRAIERLGAKLDGVLRNHQRAKDGTLRDTCCYSIIASEWPAVRAHLLWQLQRPRDAKG
jgi:RimJ/RimL family protein N-acetyltransferase